MKISQVIFNYFLTLADREWVRPVCGSKLDGDENASDNILEQCLSNYGCGM